MRDPFPSFGFKHDSFPDAHHAAQNGGVEGILWDPWKDIVIPRMLRCEYGVDRP